MAAPMRRIPREEGKGFVYIAPGAVVCGDVRLGEDVNVWFGAVLRGDEARITVGDGTNVQDNAVLHCDPGVPLEVGSYVTIGHSAVVHCASVGDRTIVGMGSVLLAGARIGPDSIVAAGSVVPPNKSYPPRSLVLGSPARVVRELTDAEVEALAESALHYIQLARSSLSVKFYDGGGDVR